MFTILQPLNTTIPPLSIVRTKSGVYLTQTPVLRSVLTLPTEQVPPEVFAVVFTNEKFSLQATTTGLYVTSYESIATCNRYIAQSYELFTPVQVGNYVALLTASGYYLTLNVSDNTFSAASFADPGSLFMFSSPTPINCSVKPGPLIMTNGSYTMKHNQTSKVPSMTCSRFFVFTRQQAHTWIIIRLGGSIFWPLGPYSTWRHFQVDCRRLRSLNIGSLLVKVANEVADLTWRTGCVQKQLGVFLLWLIADDICFGNSGNSLRLITA